MKPGDKVRYIGKREVDARRLVRWQNLGLRPYALMASILLALLLAGCGKPTSTDRGYAMERFDANGLKPSGCDDSRSEYPSKYEYVHSCSWDAPDGTRYYVSKRWDVKR